MKMTKKYLIGIVVWIVISAIIIISSVSKQEPIKTVVVYDTIKVVFDDLKFVDFKQTVDRLYCRSGKFEIFSSVKSREYDPFNNDSIYQIYTIVVFEKGSWVNYRSGQCKNGEKSIIIRRQFDGAKNWLKTKLGDYKN